jgi:UDP:flavonoid glycosyltransferase YjiC (YdhE family)
MRRVLFLPSDHGGGMGHVSRCIFLAKKLKESGHETAIVLEKKHFSAGIDAGIKTFLFDTRLERLQKYQLTRPFKPQVSLKTRIWKAPVFLEFNSLAFQVPRDGYVSEKIVAIRLKGLDKVVKSFKPDLLIGDTHFLTYILGRKNDIPVIQITRLAGYPPKPNFMWWKDNPVELTLPQAIRPFEVLIEKYLDEQISRAEDLLRGDRYLVPSCPEVEPISGNHEDTRFVGPMAPVDDNFADNPFRGYNKSLKNIYISIGGGAARSQEKQLFAKLIEVFHGSQYNVLISTGKRVPAVKYNNKSKNINFVDWVHGLTAINYADLIVFHGGYATMLEILVQGKPSLVLPSHSEQEGNGQRIENLGEGAVLPIHAKDLSPLEFSWPYGHYSFLAGYELNLERDEILSKIAKLLQSRPGHKRISEKLRALAASTDYESVLTF